MPQSQGCVQGHSAFIFDRGGQKRISPIIDISEVRWERDRDGVSEATIRLEADSCARQAELIQQLRTHRHELVIYRGSQRVWEGPLHRIGSYANYTEIVAKDVLSYVFYTPLSRVWDNTAQGDGVTEMTTRMQNIITYELSTDRTQYVYNPVTDTWDPVTVTAWENLDPPINVLPFLDVRHFPNEAKTAAKTLAYEMTVGEHLLSAARTSGIDFTAVGRRIILWDVSRHLGRLPQMTDANFYSNVVVTEYGSDHVQSAYVVGQEGVYGQAINLENLDYYGPWTQVHTAYNEEGANLPSQAELNSQASRNLSGRSPAPIEVRIPDNSSVILNAAITIDALIPGVQVPLLATLNARQISQMQKIDHVVVTENAEREDIAVTLTPATKPDLDDEED
jgi:hypothetical protein